MSTEEQVVFESLVGRTVLRVDWGEGWLLLDDGRVIHVSAQGYDDPDLLLCEETTLRRVQNWLKRPAEGV